MILKRNQILELSNKRKIIVIEVLGVGGQGEVYLVEQDNKQYALKMYIDEISCDFKYNLKSNIERKSPSSNFLWPLEYIEYKNKSGYLMELRPKEYDSFISFLNGKVKFKDLNTLIHWCIELCMSFKKLHEKGYSYQDLNDGSFFLNKDNGSILICDNDNVTADKRNLGVLGKMKYMAPEIVRGDINSVTKECQMPDIHSDRFSLAIILFMALCLGNPFEGERLKEYDFIDEKAELELYGTNPIFIYHKLDKSNRPIRGYHKSVIKRWPLLPSYIKEAFHRTFVDGLKDRENERTTELEWIKLLVQYRDELLTCRCGKQYIYGYKETKLNVKCPYCNLDTKKFCTMQIGKNTIVLEPSKHLYKFHLDKYSSEYNEKIGTVIVNKNNPSLFGIKLHIDLDVEIKDQVGTVKKISNQGVIPIINNLKIRFDENLVAQINVNNEI